ncbi:MAG: hypothetical protein JXX28_07860 [Deltaproteobacteria bacterium]|nr:hypothetical protein [Deltaproteobacteria bacterium]
MSEEAPPAYRPAVLHATMLLAAGLMIAAYALSVPPNEVTSILPPEALSAAEWTSDVYMYESLADTLRGGGEYYATLGDHLRRGNFPRVPVFNWRLPGWYSLMALLPSSGDARLLAWAGLALANALAWLGPNRSKRVALYAGITTAAFGVIAIHRHVIFMTEAPAAVLLFASLVAYARGRDRLGAALGVSALFVRELVAIYAVMAVAVALWRRRWGELLVWGAGFVAFAAFYAVHVHAVQGQLLPTDYLTENRSWLQLGGLPFVVHCVEFHPIALTFTKGGDALLLALAFFGMWQRELAGGWHLRGAALAYGLFFLVAGFPFNSYWGVLWLAPLSWLAVAGVEVLGTQIKTLVEAVRPPVQPPPADQPPSQG